MFANDDRNHDFILMFIRLLQNSHAKGLKKVLEEHGVDIRGMKKEDMQRKLNKFEDLKTGRTKLIDF